MTQPIQTLEIDECKIQASLLLKYLRADDVAQKEKAAVRFQIVPALARLTVTELYQANLKHKHALSAIALEKGFSSWTDLKAHCLKIEEEPFRDGVMGGFLNKWFNTYETAKAEQKVEGGFLFPFKHQFFIAEAGFIQYLGLDPDHADWAVMGYDWVKPRDPKARHRRFKAWLKIKAR